VKRCGHAIRRQSTPRGIVLEDRRPTKGRKETALANDASVAVNCDDAVQRCKADNRVTGWSETSASENIDGTRRSRHPLSISRSSEASTSGRTFGNDLTNYAAH